MPPILRHTGFTAAAAALHFYERQQQVHAQNLANVDTTGYKQLRVAARSVDDAVMAATAVTDRGTGGITPTANPLDLALEGEGFLVVQTPDGERWTRGGPLRLDDQRRLVTAQGWPVLGERGPIQLPAGDIGIGRDGTITVQPPVTETGRDRTARAVTPARLTVDVLRLERGDATSELAHLGRGLYAPDTTRRAIASGERQLRQGALEASNVQPIEALTSMIETVRAYADVQKSMTVLDDIRGIAANQVGKPV